MPKAKSPAARRRSSRRSVKRRKRPGKSALPKSLENLKTENIWYVPPGSKKLINPASTDETNWIRKAQPFTITLLNFTVADDLDGFLRGNNDLLVTTRSSLGTAPRVERVHFYEEEIVAGRQIDNIFAESVHLCEDYNGLDRLWVEVNVTEVDRAASADRAQAISKFSQLAQTAGAVFPLVLPYAFGATAIAGVFNNLIDTLEKDDPVIRVPIAFYAGDLVRGRRGRAPLQEGDYVAFAGEVDGSQYELDDAGNLVKGKTKIRDVSYAVFQVFRQKIFTPNHLADQKIATLLTQMKEGNDGTAQATIDFLRETIEARSNFNLLKRFNDLAELPQSELTPDEQKLMEEIRRNGALRDFLPEP